MATSLFTGLAAVVILIVHSSCQGGISDVRNCRYTDTAGKVYDLSALISRNGGYVFQAQAYTIGDFSVDSLSSDEKANYTFQLQICRNITGKPISPTCNETGAIHMLNPDKSCLSLGQSSVAAFDVNPYKDGVHLNYYHGTKVDHISHYQSKVYFVCKNDTTASEPEFEHIKGPIYQAHFKIFTKYAC